MKLKIKVCGMRESGNIAELVALSPDMMGFIFYKSSKRYAEGILDKEVLSQIPPSIKKTGVFVNEDLDKLIEIVKYYDFDIVQLHGEESPEYIEELKRKVPEKEVMKVFSVGEDFSFSTMENFEGVVDYFLLDTKTTGFGGSGHKFNWEILKNYKMDIPLILSGGIGVEDLEEIKKLIEIVPLYGVDINSKFEIAPGKKNIDLVRSFIEQLRND